MQSLSLHATPGASPNTFAQQPRAANESLIPDGTTVPGTKGVNSGTNSVVKRDQNGNKFIPTPIQTVSKQLNSPLSRSRGEGQGFYPFDSSLSIGSAGEFVPSPGDHTDNTINPADGSPDATRPQVLGAAGNASQTSSKQSRTLDVLATYSRKKLIGSGGFAKVQIFRIVMLVLYTSTSIASFVVVAVVVAAVVGGSGAWFGAGVAMEMFLKACLVK